MKNIKLNDKVDLNLEKLITGKLLLNAGSGGGKSYAIRRLLEQSFGSIPHLVLDTEGEFSSLREKYDYILIGKGFDITADPKTAALLALRLWEERVSAIIDLYELSPWDRQAFVKNFVDALVNAPKKLWKPVLLIIDEAHEYAPETDKSDSGRALHLLASKGRKRHIGAVFATQRISTLSKNIVASCKNKLIGYASETNDVKRAAFELGFTPQEARSLRDLDPGEFYAFGPALTKEVTKIKIGNVRTTHEGTPAALTRNTRGIKATPPSKKVLDALAKLADLPQAAAEEARTVGELKAEISRLKRLPAVDEKLQQKWYDLGYAAAKHNDREVKKFKDALYQKLLKSHGDMARALDSLLNEIHVLVPEREQRDYPLPKDFKKLHDFVKEQPYYPITVDETGDMPDAAWNKTMGAGERKVLMAIAQAGTNGMTREHITVQTGYKRSTRDAYLQRLVQKGYVMIGSRVRCTVEGEKALGSDYEPLPTGAELLEYHLKKLPEGEARILMLLSQREGATRDYITEATGYKRSTRDAYIQRLASRQLVVVEGQTIRISDHLL